MASSTPDLDMAVVGADINAKVLIGYPLYGRQVYAGFTHSLHRMRTPVNTDVTPQNGHTQGECRNLLAIAAMQGGYSHVFMLDTDMLYPDECLLDMLKDDNDVECCFAVARSAPHYPIFGEEGEERYTYLSQWPTTTGRRDGEPLLGAQPTVIVGGAGLLIKTSVFERVEYPWFSHAETLADGITAVGEDAYFAQKCRDAGIELFCRTDILTGHITEVTLQPQWIPAEQPEDPEDEVGDAGGEWQIATVGLGPFYSGPQEEEREKIRTAVAANKVFDSPATSEGEGV